MRQTVSKIPHRIANGGRGRLAQLARLGEANFKDDANFKGEQRERRELEVPAGE